MGRTFAEDLSTMNMPMADSIAIHLQSNHYPPVPLSMVEPCVEAIDLVNSGDGKELVELPSPITWKGQSSAPAYAIVEAHHLDSWIEENEM